MSLQSAAAVLAHINTEKFEVLPFGITRSGDWYRYGGETKRIAEDTWTKDGENLHRIVISQNRSVGGFLELTEQGYVEKGLDLAFPVLHGCLNWRGSRLSDAASWRLRSAWTRTGRTGW